MLVSSNLSHLWKHRIMETGVCPQLKETNKPNQKKHHHPQNPT